MRILSAEITGFKLHRTRRTFTFGQVNRISGGNGKGKTTISESIAWCFYGCDLSGRTKGIYEKLKNPHAKETKVVVEVELPGKGGEISVNSFCRIRKGDTTSVFLNGNKTKQAEFDSLLGSMELFLSIFIPGYFGKFAVNEPSKARNLLISMLPKLNNEEVVAQLDEEDQIRIESLEMVNPDHAMKRLRSEISELEAVLLNVEGAIQYLRIHSLISVPMRVVREDERRLQEMKGAFSSFLAGSMPSYQHDLHPLLERKAELRYQFDERNSEFKKLKASPLPRAGDTCPTCHRKHTITEAQQEFENRNARLLELKQQCEQLRAEGYVLAEELEWKTKENEELLRLHIVEREAIIAKKQAEVDELAALVKDRAHKLEMAKDLDKQHEIYGETTSEIDEKKACVQALKNFMLQYVEMQVSLVNSFLNLAKIQLFKYAEGTGEIMLDFTLTYGEAGTEYSSLSTSEKIRCSIEIAGLLNKVQMKAYPVYIDNAESIEAFDAPQTQYFVAEVIKKSALQVDVVA